jgi:hypothetical protein
MCQGAGEVMNAGHLWAQEPGKASFAGLTLFFQPIGSAAIHAAKTAGANHAGGGGCAIGQAWDAGRVSMLPTALFVKNRAVAKGAGKLAVVQEGEESGEAESGEQRKSDNTGGAITGNEECACEPNESHKTNKGEEEQTGAVDDRQGPWMVARATNPWGCGGLSLWGCDRHGSGPGFHCDNYAIYKLIYQY